MPTVATKNGGPVDIMSTLHHGLLVDPTNSTEIAAALIKILTHPETWDEMSRNGARPWLWVAFLRSQLLARSQETPLMHRVLLGFSAKAIADLLQVVLRQKHTWCKHGQHAIHEGKIGSLLCCPAADPTHSCISARRRGQHHGILVAEPLQALPGAAGGREALPAQLQGAAWGHRSSTAFMF